MINDKSSKRLKPVARLAKDKTKKSAQKFRESQLAFQAQEKQLNSLMQYKEEYEKQMLQQGSGGISGQQLHTYHAFISKLETAINQQQQAVLEARSNLLTDKTQWQKNNSRTQALNKAVDKFAEQEQKQDDKREQISLEDHHNTLTRTKKNK